MKSNINFRFDEKDYQILKLLSSDVMVPFKEIARQVGLSPPSVSARIRKLRALGVFDPTIHIDFHRIGLERYTLGLSLRTGIPPDSKDKIVGEFMDEASVISIWKTSGEHDLVIHVVFGSSHELMDFVDTKVRPLSEIRTIDVSEILEAVKQDGKNMKTNVTKDLPIPVSR